MECFSLLFAHKRVDPTVNDNAAIRSASKYGHHECVRHLLTNSRVDPSANRYEAIRDASNYGHHELGWVTLLTQNYI